MATIGELYRVRPRRRSLSRADVELAWVMYVDGHLTLREIASEMTVTPNTLSIYFREHRAAIGGEEFLASLDAIAPQARSVPYGS